MQEFAPSGGPNVKQRTSLRFQIRTKFARGETQSTIVTAASSPGPASTMLIGGAARITECTSALKCTAPVTAADVAVAGSVPVQI